MTTIVFVSEALTQQHRAMTQHAIATARESAGSIPLNIIVVERGDADYDNAIVLKDQKDEPFNYNRILNHAIRHISDDRIILCNNDVEFIDGAARVLAAQRPLVVSPVCPDEARQRDITKLTFGDQVGRHLAGWCFSIHRAVWASIGGFDELMPFWGADNLLIEQLRAIGVVPAVTPDAKVRHLVSRTISHLPDELIKRYTIDACKELQIGQDISDQKFVRRIIYSIKRRRLS